MSLETSESGGKQDPDSDSLDALDRQQNSANGDGGLHVTDTVGWDDDAKLHPLSDSWTMWFPTKAKVYANQEVLTVDCVESFWGLMKSMKDPSKLDMKTDIMFFRKGIKPEWEDPFNARGGCFVANFARAQRSSIDKAWEETLLALLGGTIKHSEIVAGAVLQLRPRYEDRIQIWIRQASPEARKRLEDNWSLILKEAKLSFSDLKYKDHEGGPAPEPAKGNNRAGGGSTGGGGSGGQQKRFGAGAGGRK